MKNLFFIFSLIGCLLNTIMVEASPFSDRVSGLVKVDNVRVYSDGDSKVRIVLDTANPVEYNTFVLANPTRIAVDIKGAWLSPLIPKETPVHGGLVGKVRISQFNSETVRVVVEANVSRDRYKIFTLKPDPDAEKSARLVMDFGDLAQEHTSDRVSESALPSVGDANFPEPKEIRLFDKPGLKGKKIAIDPGHGGSDPGSIGANGAKEKDITLAIALELKKMLEDSGAVPIMTRTTDVDVGPSQADDREELQARVDVADKAKADVFISIHMDAFVNRQVKGTSSYIYPKTTGDARLGTFIKDGVVNQLGTDDRNMRQCNFYVVKYSHMPATLVEIAFISNLQEEKMMTSSSGVTNAATGILQGLERYFSYE